jgi:class 3 adenylate cyclase
MVARADGEPTATADVAHGFDPARPTVLYAEDSEDLRHHVHDLLAPLYNVVLAVDGRDGLEKAREHLPDLILADQMMPLASGRDLLRAIRADRTLCATPVVFLTARAGTDARIESLEAGADDYLAKPFHGAELLARIRNLLQARAQERELARLNHELEGLNRDLTQRVQEQVGQLERLGKLKRFFSSQLAESIVAGDMDDPLRTHRRELVVVFGDLRGFTAFSETAEPEVVMNVLREFHAAIGALIVAYEGTLERFTGDGMMVFFNDPVPVANAAERAVRMAVAIRDRVSQLVGKWRRLGYDLDLGQGIDQGYATIGAIGFEGRWDYGAIGTVTNLAARLCAEAKPGQILISPRILAEVEAIVKVEPVGPLTLKGFSRPVPAWDVRSMTVNGKP